MKKSLIIVTVIITVLSIGIVTSNIINKKLEEVIISGLSNGMGKAPFSYEDVTVSVTKMLLTISGAEYVDDDVRIKIGNIDLQLPLKNVVDIKHITDLTVSISEMSISDHIGTFQIIHEDLKANINGRMNIDNIPNNSDLLINRIDIKSDDVKVIFSLGEFIIPHLNWGVEGEIDVSDIKDDYKGIRALYSKDLIDGIYINFEELEYIADKKIKQGLTMMSFMILGDVSLINDKKNWIINEFSLNADLLEDTVVIDSIELITDWLNLDIYGSVTINENLDSYTPLDLNLNLNDYNRGLRPILEMLVSNVTQESLPEGSVSLGLSMVNNQSLPNLSIKK